MEIENNLNLEVCKNPLPNGFSITGISSKRDYCVYYRPPCVVILNSESRDHFWLFGAILRVIDRYLLLSWAVCGAAWILVPWVKAIWSAQQNGLRALGYFPLYLTCHHQSLEVITFSHRNLAKVLKDSAVLRSLGKTGFDAIRCIRFNFLQHHACLL